MASGRVFFAFLHTSACQPKGTGSGERDFTKTAKEKAKSSLSLLFRIGTERLYLRPGLYSSKVHSSRAIAIATSIAPLSNAGHAQSAARLEAVPTKEDDNCSWRGLGSGWEWEWGFRSGMGNQYTAAQRSSLL